MRGIKYIFNNKKIYIFFEILFSIIILTLISTNVLGQPLNDLDELWNYNFSKNIVEGRLPYKDFNIITMPLVPYIGAVFLLIFGNQLLSMRIFAIIVNFIILYFSYIILKTIKIDKNVAKVVTILLYYLLQKHFRIDYNFFSIMILLIIIYIEILNIKNCKENNYKIDMLLGFLAGLCICCKQTVGISISVITVFYPILLDKNKDELKITIKKIIFRILGLLIPVSIMTLYFTLFKLWSDFIDYSVLGLKDFKNKIPYITLIKNDKIHIKILSIVVPVYLITNTLMTIIKKIKKEKIDTANLILLVYSWASIIIVFPISDEIHFLIASYTSFIGAIYLICNKILKIQNKLILMEIAANVLTIYLTVCCVINLNKLSTIYSYINKNDEINHFKNIPIISKDNIKEIDNYILNQNKKVYILNSNAAIYTIPIDQYTKKFDMFNKGNLGSKGEEGVIKDIKNLSNAQFLILQDIYSYNWQTPFKVITYIKNNLKLIGKVGEFDIYEN